MSVRREQTRRAARSEKHISHKTLTKVTSKKSDIYHFKWVAAVFFCICILSNSLPVFYSLLWLVIYSLCASRSSLLLLSSLTLHIQSLAHWLIVTYAFLINLSTHENKIALSPFYHKKYFRLLNLVMPSVHKMVNFTL